MTTTNPPSTYERHQQALAEATVYNKDAVFEALSVAKIAFVYVNFNGAHDEGHVSRPVASDGRELLPKTTVTLQEVPWGHTAPLPVTTALSEAIEMLCYHYLDQEHNDWAVDEGSFGEFVFDVARRKITLFFNQRQTTSLLYEYTF